jgi:hypothetical protein
MVPDTEKALSQYKYLTEKPGYDKKEFKLPF